MNDGKAIRIETILQEIAFVAQGLPSQFGIDDANRVLEASRPRSRVPVGTVFSATFFD